MEFQLVLPTILIFGIVISTWMLTSTSKRIQRERDNIIRNRITLLGGNVIKIDQVKRKDCPLSDEFHEVDLSYKFFRCKYTQDEKLREGWAVLGMKQNWYGPNGAIDAKWIWRF